MLKWLPIGIFLAFLMALWPVGPVTADEAKDTQHRIAVIAADAGDVESLPLLEGETPNPISGTENGSTQFGELTAAPAPPGASDGIGMMTWIASPITLRAHAGTLMIGNIHSGHRLLQAKHGHVLGNGDFGRCILHPMLA